MKTRNLNQNPKLTSWLTLLIVTLQVNWAKLFVRVIKYIPAWSGPPLKEYHHKRLSSTNIAGYSTLCWCFCPCLFTAIG